MSALQAEPSGVDLTLAIRATLENAARLAEDANIYLAELERRQTAFVISVLAREEFAKAFLLILCHNEQLPWTVDLQNALRSHVCKQLVSFVLCELSEVDLFDPAYIDKWPRRVRELPPHVVEAFHVLVHEHFRGREREDWWDASQDSPLNPSVHEIAAGALERNKQDALYVRLGWNGSVRSAPSNRITDAEWRREARRLDLMKDAFSVTQGKLSGSPLAQYRLTAALVRVLSGSMTVEEFNDDWW